MLGFGLPQFIAFLNKSNDVGGSSTRSPRTENNGTRNRVGGGGEGSSTAGTYTALPRPKRSSASASKRKSSVSSQMTDGYMYSMTPPETPRSGSDTRMFNSLDPGMGVESSLASIPSSGHSTPTEEDKGSASMTNGKSLSKMTNSPSSSRLPTRTQPMRSSAASPRVSSRQDRTDGRTTVGASPKVGNRQVVDMRGRERGRQKITASSESVGEAASFTTLGNPIKSKDGTNSEYLLIKNFRPGTDNT